MIGLLVTVELVVFRTAMLSSMYFTLIEDLLSYSINAFPGIPTNPTPYDSRKWSVCVDTELPTTAALVA